MLSGREHFYKEWPERLREVVARGPVLDLGTSQPFRKEMQAIEGYAAAPYFCADYIASPAVSLMADGHELPFRDELPSGAGPQQQAPPGRRQPSRPGRAQPDRVRYLFATR